MDSNIGDDLGLGIALPGSRLVDAQGHRKVHPLTPLVHAVAVVPAMIGVAIAFSAPSGFAWMKFIPGLGSIATIFLGLAVLTFLLSALVAGYQYLAWRALSFWFDSDGDFRVRSGVLIRQERRVQLSRIQAVDVIQPLAARIFSLAVLVIEVAGQDKSRVQLKYLTLADAREIRGEVLARSAGLHASTPEAPQNELFRVATRDLVLSLLLRSSTLGLLLVSAVLLVISYLTEGWAGLGIALATGAAPIVIVIAEFLRYYGFTISESPDGLRLKYGLLRTETRTVPPGRVQSIDFVEPLLWRRWAWTRVRINIAGVGKQSSDGNSQNQETLLTPVAPIALARALVARVLPDLNVEKLTWHSAPVRAKRRSPIQWHQLAVAWDEHVFAIRRGRVTRHLAAVPHARTQSVRYTQGPWERALGLASVHVDTTPGPVRVTGLHLDANFAQEVAHEQAARAHLARTDGTS